MITIDSLLAIAAREDELCCGKSGLDSYNHRLRRDKAFRTAEHMERIGLTEANHVGEFDTHSYVGGQKVRLRKGAVVFSTNPQVPREGKLYGVNRTITIQYVNAGYTGLMNTHSEGVVRNTSINWSGTGSYWYWTDANNVEPVA